MPKATLEFNLPKESEEHAAALKGSEYLSTLQSLREVFRAKAKYCEDKIEWGDAYVLFWETLKEAGVEID